MTAPENPFAFPSQDGKGWNDGMTLRDWIAARVLQAVLTGPDEPLPYGVNLTDWRVEVAANSYAWADAMLAARGLS